MNPKNIITFNLDFKEFDYNNFFFFEGCAKSISFFLVGSRRSQIYLKKKTIKLVGTYNLNSNNLNLEATDISNQFKFNSSINIIRSFENNELLFKNTELLFGDYALFASSLSFNFVERTFEFNVTKFFNAF